MTESVRPLTPQKTAGPCQTDQEDNQHEENFHQYNREMANSQAKGEPEAGMVQVMQVTPGSIQVLLNGRMNKLVVFLLQKYYAQQSTTKHEILSQVFKNEHLFPSFFKEAREYMQLLLGINIEEVDPTSQTYALTTTLGLTYDGLRDPGRGLPKTSLLIFVLGIIVWEGHCATEEEVWRVLGRIGVYAGKEHFIYGEPQELLMKEWVQEKYLVYQQMPGSNPACYGFLWGPRAHAETNKVRVLEICLKINSKGLKYFSWSRKVRVDSKEQH